MKDYPLEQLIILEAFEDLFDVNVYYYDYDKNGYDFRFVVDGTNKMAKWHGEDLAKHLEDEYHLIFKNMEHKHEIVQASLKPIIDFVNDPPEDKHFNWVMSDALHGLFDACVKALQ